ncbi:MAG: O-antigen ligase family protein [Candidatus Promineofilum sp.]|nr:O-antigen ligase family protein [Promineifilum sp.]
MDNPFIGQQEVQSSNLSFRNLDLAILTLTAPFLLAPSLFSRAMSGIALLLLLFPYIMRLVFGRPLSRPTVVNLPVAVLALVFMPLAFLLSPEPWGLTWARLLTLAWSISLFFVVVNWPHPARKGDLRTRLNGPTLFYLLLGGGIAVAGILGMRSVDKLFFLPQTGVLVNYLGWEHGLPTNEIAGALTLFIPFVGALVYGCLVTGRRRQFLLLLPLAAVMGLALVLTQSRTGLTATAIGTLLAWLSADRFNRKWLIVGVVIIALAIALVRLTPIGDWFVYAGANSWNSVIGPRWGIWNQALDAIRDHPLWGMGLGVFGSVARDVYPLITPAAGPLLEDAHNLYLQTALDFGLAGVLIFLVIAVLVVVSAVRLVRVRPPQTLSRMWAAGLLGALIAHALYSLTDAVALGTWAGVPLWIAFGLVIGVSRGRLQMAWSGRARVALAGSVSLVLLVSAMAWPVNRAGQLATHAILDPAADIAATTATLSELSAGNCRARWFDGLVRHMAGDVVGRNAVWSGLLNCSTTYTGYMAVLAADDVTLARQAIETEPENAAGYFWLASAVAAGDPQQAISLYQAGLELAPTDAHRWLALAELLEPNDPAAALDAYLLACRNGDPGANGCLRAGSLAEAGGDLPAAIEYYRLSKWSGALDRADELERQLVAGQP